MKHTLPNEARRADDGAGFPAVKERVGVVCVEHGRYQRTVACRKRRDVVGVCAALARYSLAPVCTREQALRCVRMQAETGIHLYRARDVH